MVLCRHCMWRFGIIRRFATKKQQFSSILTDNQIWPVDKIRNIGVVAHVDAGKTTTTERMLFLTGMTDYVGEVDRGDTVTDFMDQERERGISIQSAAVTFYWNKHRLNLVDTPGHVDFTVEVERCLRVLDGTVTILDASAGVEAQTQTVWRQAQKFGVPSLVYLNKMDKPGASIEKCLASIRKKLDVKPVLVQCPVFDPSKLFIGVCDLAQTKSIVWLNQLDPRHMTTSPLTNDHELIEKQYEQMIEAISEVDDEFAEHYLNNDPINEEYLTKTIRNLTIKRKIVPVLCGASVRNRGIQPLLNAICNYLPSPAEHPATEQLISLTKTVSNPNNATEPQDLTLCAMAFKIMHHERLGALTFIRVYTGTLKSGETFYNLNHEIKEDANKLFLPYSDELKEVSSVSAGNIAVVAGLKFTKTGDCLVENEKCAQEMEKQYAQIQVNASEQSGVPHDDVIRFEPIFRGIEIPEPVFFCSIEPPSLRLQRTFEFALEQLQREDPSLRVRFDPESNETVLEGMGELHIEVIKERLKREFNLDVFVGPLQINYREGISGIAEYELTLDEEIGGKKQNVLIGLEVQPDVGVGKLEKLDFRNVSGETSLSTLRKDWLNCVAEGCQAGCRSGPILGYVVQDVRVALIKFEASRGISYPLIVACTEQCLQNAFRKAGANIIEPIMEVEVTIHSSDYLSAVLSDLSKRDSQIKNVQVMSDQSCSVVNCNVALSQLLGYASSLRSISSGLASFHMKLSGYDKANADKQKSLIENFG